VCGPPFPFHGLEARPIAEFLQWIGFGLCHQLPARSFAGGGVQVPVCARDTGIYIGFVVAFAIIAALHRPRRPTEFPRPYVWAVMGALLFLLAVDGLSSYGGLRPTTNPIRLATGLGVGFSAAVLVYPMLQDVLWRRSDRDRVLEPSWRFGVWLAGIPVTFAAVLRGGPAIGIAYPVAVAVCIVLTLSAVNLVMIGILPAFDRRADRLVQLAVPCIAAVVLAFCEIALASWIRMLIESAASGL